MGRAGKLDLAAGIVLGLVLGVVVAYLLVIVLGNSRDVSPVSTRSTAPPARESTSGNEGAAGGPTAPPAQRR